MYNNSYNQPIPVQAQAPKKDTTKAILALWAGIATIVAIIGCVFTLGSITDTKKEEKKEEQAQVQEEEKTDQRIGTAQASPIINKAYQLSQAFENGSLSGVATVLELGDIQINEAQDSFGSLRYANVGWQTYLTEIYKIYEPGYYTASVDPQAKFFGRVIGDDATPMLSTRFDQSQPATIYEIEPQCVEVADNTFEATFTRYEADIKDDQEQQSEDGQEVIKNKEVVENYKVKFVFYNNQPVISSMVLIEEK